MKYKENIKLIILLAVIIIMCILNNKVFAVMYTVNLNTNKNQVSSEEIFEVTLSVNTQEEIGVYYTKIEYDESKFELIDAKGLDKWDNPTINNGELISTTKDGEMLKGEQNLAVITFKAKEDVKDVESKIEAKEFKTSNTENIVLAENAEVTIGKKSENEIQNNITNNVTNNTQNNENNNVTTITSNKKDNTLIGSILPKTGGRVALGVVVAIINVGISIVLIIYTKNKKRR